MPENAVRITYSNVTKDGLQITVQSIDGRTGAFYSTTETVTREGIKAAVDRHLASAKKHAFQLAKLQVDEELAMNNPQEVE